MSKSEKSNVQVTYVDGQQVSMKRVVKYMATADDGVDLGKVTVDGNAVYVRLDADGTWRNFCKVYYY